jgi:glycosyltransferase involved in cell wall biosynthesis
VLARARVALAPLVTGTGVNTKTGFYLAHGVPVVGSEKGVRGYGDAGAGYRVAAAPDAVADACVELHEDAAAWAAASAAALEATARLEDERARGEDLAALVAAIRRAL